MKIVKRVFLVVVLALLACLIFACDKDNVDFKLDITGDTSVYVGESITLNLDSDLATLASEVIVWSSSNPDIATVDNGVITGVSAGEVTITVTIASKDFQVTITVMDKGVNPQDPKKETLDSPINVVLSDKVVKWNKVENATQYEVHVGDNVFYTNELQYDFTNVETSDCLIYVIAVGDDTYNNSYASTSVRYSINKEDVLSSIVEQIASLIKLELDKTNSDFENEEDYNDYCDEIKLVEDLSQIIYDNGLSTSDITCIFNSIDYLDDETPVEFLNEIVKVENIKGALFSIKSIMNLAIEKNLFPQELLIIYDFLDDKVIDALTEILTKAKIIYNEISTKYMADINDVIKLSKEKEFYELTTDEINSLIDLKNSLVDLLLNNLPEEKYVNVITDSIETLYLKVVEEMLNPTKQEDVIPHNIDLINNKPIIMMLLNLDIIGDLKIILQYLKTIDASDLEYVSDINEYEISDVFIPLYFVLDAYQFTQTEEIEFLSEETISKASEFFQIFLTSSGLDEEKITLINSVFDIENFLNELKECGPILDDLVDTIYPEYKELVFDIIQIGSNDLTNGTQNEELIKKIVTLLQTFSTKVSEDDLGNLYDVLVEILPISSISMVYGTEQIYMDDNETDNNETDNQIDVLALMTELKAILKTKKVEIISIVYDFKEVIDGIIDVTLNNKFIDGIILSADYRDAKFVKSIAKEVNDVCSTDNINKLTEIKTKINALLNSSEVTTLINKIPDLSESDVPDMVDKTLTGVIEMIATIGETATDIQTYDFDNLTSDQYEIITEFLQMFRLGGDFSPKNLITTQDIIIDEDNLTITVNYKDNVTNSLYVKANGKLEYVISNQTNMAQKLMYLYKYVTLYKDDCVVDGFLTIVVGGTEIGYAEYKLPVNIFEKLENLDISATFENNQITIHGLEELDLQISVTYDTIYDYENTSWFEDNSFMITELYGFEGGELTITVLDSISTTLMINPKDIITNNTITYNSATNEYEIIDYIDASELCFYYNNEFVYSIKLLNLEKTDNKYIISALSFVQFIGYDLEYSFINNNYKETEKQIISFPKEIEQLGFTISTSGCRIDVSYPNNYLQNDYIFITDGEGDTYSYYNDLLEDSKLYPNINFYPNSNTQYRLFVSYNKWEPNNEWNESKVFPKLSNTIDYYYEIIEDIEMLSISAENGYVTVSTNTEYQDAKIVLILRDSFVEINQGETIDLLDYLEYGFESNNYLCYSIINGTGISYRKDYYYQINITDLISDIKVDLDNGTLSFDISDRIDFESDYEVLLTCGYRDMFYLNRIDNDKNVFEFNSENLIYPSYGIKIKMCDITIFTLSEVVLPDINIQIVSLGEKVVLNGENEGFIYKAELKANTEYVINCNLGINYNIEIQKFNGEGFDGYRMEDKEYFETDEDYECYFILQLYSYGYDNVDEYSFTITEYVNPKQ